MIFEAQLQKDRAEDRGEDDQEDCSEKRIDSARADKVFARRINGERHLAPRDHAAADRERFFSAVAEGTRGGAAAEDLSEDAEGDKAKREPKPFHGKVRKIGADSDIGKEHRRKEHIAAHDNLAVNKGAVVQSRQHKSRHIGARDRSDSEEFFGAVSVKKTHGKGKNTCAALVGIDTDQRLEHNAENQSKTDGKDKEARRLQKSRADASAAVKTRDDAQNDNADHVVDDGGAEHRRSRMGIELAQLTQGLDRDTDARCGKDTADKQRIQEKRMVVCDGESAHEEERAERAQRNGKRNADTGDGGRRKSALFQLRKIGLESARKQNKDNADLRKAVQNVKLGLGGNDQSVKGKGQV